MNIASNDNIPIGFMIIIPKTIVDITKANTNTVSKNLIPRSSL